MIPFKRAIAYYSLGLVVFEAVVLTYVFLFDRLGQMQLINSFNSPLADLFFKIISSGAEIAIPVSFLGYLVWKKKAFVKPYVISYIMSTMIIQFLKLLVFKDALRPLAYFKGQSRSWHIVQDLLISEYNSMPSGHTSAAWLMCFWMSVVFESRMFTLLLILYASLVGYSRVYLFQHFPIDTALGAFVGTGISFLVYFFMFQNRYK